MICEVVLGINSSSSQDSQLIVETMTGVVLTVVESMSRFA